MKTLMINDNVTSESSFTDSGAVQSHWYQRASLATQSASFSYFYRGYWLKKFIYPEMGLNLATAESRPDFG